MRLVWALALFAGCGESQSMIDVPPPCPSRPGTIGFATTSDGRCEYTCPRGFVFRGYETMACIDPLTDPRYCGEVDVNAECRDVGRPLRACHNGQCSPLIPLDLAAPTCAPWQTRCDDPAGGYACVALDSERRNCGRCGNVCRATPTGVDCIHGVCTPR